MELFVLGEHRSYCFLVRDQAWIFQWALWKRHSDGRFEKGRVIPIAARTEEMDLVVLYLPMGNVQYERFGSV